MIDFSYSCAAADKMSTDLRARAVSLRQLSYLFFAARVTRVKFGGAEPTVGPFFPAKFPLRDSYEVFNVYAIMLK